MKHDTDTLMLLTLIALTLLFLRLGYVMPRENGHKI